MKRLRNHQNAMARHKSLNSPKNHYFNNTHYAVAQIAKLFVGRKSFRICLKKFNSPVSICINFLYHNDSDSYSNLKDSGFIVNPSCAFETLVKHMQKHHVDYWTKKSIFSKFCGEIKKTNLTDKCSWKFN